MKYEEYIIAIAPFEDFKNGKVGTIVSLHTESYKYIHYYKYIPMIKVELDENKDLEYIAALSNIKKI